jgi:Protein of unknown function (DUF4012)
VDALVFALVFVAVGFVLGAGIDFVWTSRTRRTTDSVAGGNRVRGALAGAVVVAAGLAVFAPGEPTGLVPFDGALRMVFAGLVVIGCALAGRTVLVAVVLGVCGTVIVGAAQAKVPSTLLGTAGVALGLVSALLILGRRSRVAQAVVGVLVAVCVLRLPTSLPARLPSAVGALVAVVLAAAAWPSLEKRSRRSVQLGSLAVVVLGGVAGLSGGVALLRARSAAEGGVTQAREGLRLARLGERANAENALGAAEVSLQETKRRLHTPLARIGLAVPFVSQHLRTLDRLTGVASDVVTSARLTSADANLSSFKSSSGSIDLKAVSTLSTSLSSTVQTLERAQREMAKPVGPWLVPQVQERIATLRTEIDDASRETTSILALSQRLPALLGGTGERRYLLVLPTPAEARGSGGVIGNYGEIVAVDGKLSLARFGRQKELQDGGRPLADRVATGPPDFLARYNRFAIAQTWSNMNMGPDFGVVAASMADMYTQSGGEPVDGVISADPIALAGLLGVLGPLNVPEWNEPLTSENTARVLLHDSYVVNAADQTGRVSLLADVATGVWTKLKETNLDNPRGLVTAMGPSARGRHLQFWMRDPADQAYLRLVGLTGEVPTAGSGDSFSVIVNNASANKIEYYLNRTITYDATLAANGTMKAAVSVTLRNDAPSSGEPDYIIGNQIAVDPPPVGTSLLYVSLYSPLELGEIRLDGQVLPPEKVEKGTELGRNVWSVWVMIPSKSSRVLTLSLSGTTPSEPYRLRWFTQPLVNADDVAVTIRGGRERGRRTLRTDGRNSVTEFLG